MGSVSHGGRFCRRDMVLAVDDRELGHDLRQLSSGLPDAVFVSDGLMTKRPLRAFALAMLAPVGGERLWDLGAGTGSIGIEWCRLDEANTAIAVERDPARAARIAVNAERLGAAGRVEVVVADVATALPGLASPNAVFVGGGVSAGVLESSWRVLAAGGRLVAHSVTAESDAVLLGAYRRLGGELTRVGVEVAEPIGRFTGFKPYRSVCAWAARKA